MLSSSRSSTPAPNDTTGHLGLASSTPAQNSVFTGPSSNEVTSSPPRKRQRTRTIVDHSESRDQSRQQLSSCSHTEDCSQEAFCEAGSSAHSHPNEQEDSDDDLTSPANRDEKFYYPEADCVIRVEDTLFRVHKFMLARDSSAFEDMFTLPANSDPQSARWEEGTSDKNPIKLFGDTAEEFRVLLDLLYSLPPQLEIYQTSEAPISQLLTLTSILNKYHFTTTSNWALTCLYDVLSGRHGTPIPAHNIDHSQCVETLLARIIKVACVCGHTQLRDFVEERWCARICLAAGSLMGIDSYRREREARWAIHVADEWDLKRLAGIAYYALLLESTNSKISRTFTMPTHQNAEPSQTTTTPDSQPNPWSPPPLTDRQVLRLLSGHRSIVHLWDNLISNTPTFQRPEGCVFHVHGCLSAWHTAWRDVSRSEQTVYKHRSCDLLGRLNVMEDQLQSNTDLQCALTPMCRRRAMGAVRELREKVTLDLIHHFEDGVPVDDT